MDDVPGEDEPSCPHVHTGIDCDCGQLLAACQHVVVLNIDAIARLAASHALSIVPGDAQLAAQYARQESSLAARRLEYCRLDIGDRAVGDRVEHLFDNPSRSIDLGILLHTGIALDASEVTLEPAIFSLVFGIGHGSSSGRSFGSTCGSSVNVSTQCVCTCP